MNETRFMCTRSERLAKRRRRSKRKRIKIIIKSIALLVGISIVSGITVILTKYFKL